MSDQMPMPAQEAMTAGDLSGASTTILGFTVAFADLQVAISALGLFLGIVALYYTIKFHRLAHKQRENEIRLREIELGLRKPEDYHV